MKLQIDLDEGSELLQTLHRIEATIDRLIEVWNTLCEVSDENLGDLEIVRSDTKDGVTLYY